MDKIEIETLIIDWTDIYNKLDKRTGEAKVIQETILDLFRKLIIL